MDDTTTQTGPFDPELDYLTLSEPLNFVERIVYAFMYLSNCSRSDGRIMFRSRVGLSTRTFLYRHKKSTSGSILLLTIRHCSKISS